MSGQVHRRSTRRSRATRAGTTASASRSLRSVKSVANTLIAGQTVQQPTSAFRSATRRPGPAPGEHGPRRTRRRPRRASSRRRDHRDQRRRRRERRRPDGEVNAHKPNQKVTLTVTRSGKSLSIDVTLGVRPHSSRRSVGRRVSRPASPARVVPPCPVLADPFRVSSRQRMPRRRMDHREVEVPTKAPARRTWSPSWRTTVLANGSAYRARRRRAATRCPGTAR